MKHYYNGICFLLFCCCMEWIWKNIKIRNQVGFSFLFVVVFLISFFTLVRLYQLYYKAWKVLFINCCHLLLTIFLFLTLFLSLQSSSFSHEFSVLLLFFLSDLSCAVVLCFLYNSTTMVIHSFLTRNYERPMKLFWRFVQSLFAVYIFFGVIFYIKHLFHCIRRLHATKMMKWLRMDWKGANIFHYTYIRYIYIYLCIFFLWHTKYQRLMFLIKKYVFLVAIIRHFCVLLVVDLFTL